MISKCGDCKFYKHGKCYRKWHIWGTKQYITIHVNYYDFSCDSFQVIEGKEKVNIEKTPIRGYGDNSSTWFE
jgi:hypothetical protein